MKNSESPPADRIRVLKSIIRDKVKGRVAVVGIGNILRGDDGLGPRFIEILKKRPPGNAVLFDCGTAPENYIFPILASACDTVILVDAASLGLPAGEAKVFDLEEIADVGFSTHNPSPRLFTDLLMTGRDNLNIFVVTVQTKTTAFGEAVSEDVLAGLHILADAFCEALL